MKKKIHKLFVKLMMAAPPVALDLDYYKMALDSVTERFKTDNIKVNPSTIARHKTEIQEEFTWFEGEEGGGYFINMNDPRKMVKEELYKFLGIENNPTEQQKADTMYGTE